jgi:hypothetical protein
LDPFSIFMSYGEYGPCERGRHHNGEHSRSLPNNADRRRFKSRSLF